MKKIWVCWAVLLSVAFAGRWLFHIRWEKYWVQQATMANQTVDCAHDPLLDHIEVSERNANTLFQSGFVRALVGEGEGCYGLNSAVMVYSIVRTSKGRAIYQKQPWARARVSMIIDTDYQSMPAAQKAYVEKKFKDQATHLRYQMITLAAMPFQRPQPPTLVPITHPAAENISLSDALAKTKAQELWLLDLGAHVVAEKNVFRVAYDGSRAAIEDPETQYDLVGSQPWLTALPKDRPLVVIPDDERDLRGYNLVSELMIAGFNHLYWVRSGWVDSLAVPAQLANLETVDCWKAIRLLKDGVPLADKAQQGENALWLGKNEYDKDFFDAAVGKIKESGVSGFWLPGGQNQLKWCQSHDLATKFDLSEEM